ncbi:MAG: gfo/Idh/MocA family oxidoreductase, partial [Thermoguttaceae bacterium]|nr:gfo/Idh/MocA family oxidoreductase [Thermoguttaceae bacterium]
RNDIVHDRIRMPKRVLCAGGRVGYNDAGQTPNSIMIYFDTGSIPVVFCISNLPDKDNLRSAGDVAGPTSGYIAYCEGGRY